MAGCSTIISIIRAALRVYCYLCPQLSKDAVKAECEGLAGCALRSVATTMAKDAERHEIVVALEALSDTVQGGPRERQPQVLPDPPNEVGGGDNDGTVVAAEVKKCGGVRLEGRGLDCA